jgi:hypothetical protein
MTSGAALASVYAVRLAPAAFGHGPWYPFPWSPRRVEIPPAGLTTASTVRVRWYSGLARAFDGRWFEPMADRYRLIGVQEDEATGGSAIRSRSPRLQWRLP